jgi:polyhydroxybutyrate depolymerase
MKLGYAALAVPMFVGVAVLSGYMLRMRNSDDPRGTITVGGRERTYSLHVPDDYDGAKAMPLVLALHGRLGTGTGQEKLAHLDKVSDAHGFLVVYPDGLDRSWADGREGTPSDKNGVDDVKFLSALIDKIESESKVDAKHVYAVGMSNGGFMSGRLACDLSERIAAVGIVGASLSEAMAANCHPAKAVSVMMIQGTADPIVPIAGGTLQGGRGVVLSHDAAMKRFVEVNKCTGEPTKNHIADSVGDGTSVDVTSYESCAEGSEVVGYVVNGGGHTWPGGMQYLPAMFIGKTTHNLDGSEVIWKFLERHRRE